MLKDLLGKGNELNLEVNKVCARISGNSPIMLNRVNLMSQYKCMIDPLFHRGRPHFPN